MRITDFLTIEEIAKLFHRRRRTIERFLSIYYEHNFTNEIVELPDDILMIFIYSETEDITKEDIIEFSRYVFRFQEGSLDLSSEELDRIEDKSEDVAKGQIQLDYRKDFFSQEYYDYCWSDDADNEETTEPGIVEEYDGKGWTVREIMVPNDGQSDNKNV